MKFVNSASAKLNAAVEYVANIGNGYKLVFALLLLSMVMPLLGLLLDSVHVDPAVFISCVVYVAVFVVSLNGHKLVVLCNV